MPPSQPPATPPQPAVNSAPVGAAAPAQPLAAPQTQAIQPQSVQPNPVVQPQQVAQPQVALPAPAQPVVQVQMQPNQGLAVPTQQQPQQVVPQAPMAPLPPVGGPTAAPAGYKHPPSKVMKIVTIAITIIAILVCSYGAVHVFKVRKEKYGFASDADKQRKEQTKKAVENSGPETEKRTDGKLNLSKLFDAEYAPHDQDIKAGLNEQINIANGFSFMVTGIEGGWQKSGEYEAQAAPGKEFIKVAVVIGNRAEKGTMSFYTSKLELSNSKGGKQTEVYTDSDDIPNNGLESSSSINLNPGDQRSGWVVYEIDKGETVSLIYEQKVFACRANDNKDCLMKGSVKLQ